MSAIVPRNGAIIEVGQPPPVLAKSQQDWDFPTLLLVAEHLHKSGLYREIANPSAALALILRAQAEGVPPGLALAQYHVIEGKPTLRADAIHDRFVRAGGRIQFTVLTDDEVEAVFSHPVHCPEGVRIKQTMEQHRKSGVAIAKDGKSLKDNWAKWPRAMLRSRVVSEGVRTVLPGVMVGIYSPEEIADQTPLPGTPPTVIAPTPDWGKLEQDVSQDLPRIYRLIHVGLAAVKATEQQVRASLTARGVAAVEELDWTNACGMLQSIERALGHRVELPDNTQAEEEDDLPELPETTRPVVEGKKK